MATFQLKQNDRLPKLRAALTDSTGAALDLTGATVGFRMRARGTGTAVVLTGTAAAVTPATSGVVEYTWGAGDTATPGVYDAEWVLTYAGSVQTVPTTGYLVVVVEPAIA